MNRAYGRNSVAELTQVLAPTFGTDESIDWELLSARWGTRFPGDYIAFMQIFGAGGISDSLEVLRPSSPSDDIIDGVTSATADARDQWPPTTAPAGATDTANAEDSVIAWGVTPAADTLCWLTSGTDPDLWPVAVLRASLSAPWTVYPMGMAEFLHRLIVGDLDSCPLGEATLWAAGTGHFLHWREEERLLGEGFDPWTGEPDPLANIKFDSP
ncbi:SMI1/KNR4 family protein [Streptomyces sp. NPDC056749]|uniref:SMI1/KNR4 family protein n=1 Tax=Streptomyces sp. NPDC056749 TaxID=3345936 RepID=UPI00367F5E3A